MIRWLDGYPTFLSLVLPRFSSRARSARSPMARECHFTATISLYLLRLYPLPPPHFLWYCIYGCCSQIRAAHARYTRGCNVRVMAGCIRGVRGESREQECAARAYLANARHPTSLSLSLSLTATANASDRTAFSLIRHAFSIFSQRHELRCPNAGMHQGMGPPRNLRIIG